MWEYCWRSSEYQKYFMSVDWPNETYLPYKTIKPRESLIVSTFTALNLIDNTLNTSDNIIDT